MWDLSHLCKIENKCGFVLGKSTHFLYRKRVIVKKMMKYIVCKNRFCLSIYSFRHFGKKLNNYCRDIYNQFLYIPMLTLFLKIAKYELFSPKIDIFLVFFIYIVFLSYILKEMQNSNSLSYSIVHIFKKFYYDRSKIEKNWEVSYHSS